MAKKKHQHHQVVPEQDGRIVGTICVCQLTMILSGVALVYLSVAVYAPSHKAFTSGFERTPVMCDTYNASVVKNCPWASCAEWCLTRPTGNCTQIFVWIRRQGSNLTLTGCSTPQQAHCPMANVDILPRINCTKPPNCIDLKGLFNCRQGFCANISEVLKCDNHGVGSSVKIKRGMENTEGNYECAAGRCKKVKSQLNCDHICPRIITGPNNVFLTAGSTVIATRCAAAAATDPSAPWPAPAPLWSPSDGILLTACYTFSRSGDTITASDCVNGTVIPASLLPPSYINATHLREIWWTAMNDTNYQRPRTNLVPRGGALLPPSMSLRLHENVSMLFINLDRCVNTLRGECKDFLDEYGLDGSNHTALSRFPCYYNKGNFSAVLARFDLEETWRDLMVAIFLPTILFIVSMTTLCVITRSVKVGDDTKLRCLSQCCESGSTRNSQATAAKQANTTATTPDST